MEVSWGDPARPVRRCRVVAGIIDGKADQGSLYPPAVRGQTRNGGPGALRRAEATRDRRGGRDSPRRSSRSALPRRRPASGRPPARGGPLGHGRQRGRDLAAAQGGPLYGVWLWFEEVTLPSQGRSRTDADVARLQHRLDEAQQAALNGNAGAVSAALAAYRETVDDAISAAATKLSGWPASGRARQPPGGPPGPGRHGPRPGAGCDPTGDREEQPGAGPDRRPERAKRPDHRSRRPDHRSRRPRAGWTPGTRQDAGARPRAEHRPHAKARPHARCGRHPQAGPDATPGRAASLTGLRRRW